MAIHQDTAPVTPPWQAVPHGVGSLPAPASSGLSSQVATLTGLLGSFVSDLDPDTLLGADAAALYASLAIGAPGGGGQEPAGPPDRRLGPLGGRGPPLPGRPARRPRGGPDRPGPAHPGDRQAPRGPARDRGGPAGRGPVGGQGRRDRRRRRRRPRCRGELLAGAAEECLAATKERCRRVRATSARQRPGGRVPDASTPSATSRTGPTARGRSASRAGTRPSGGRPCSPAWSPQPTDCGTRGGRQPPG